MVIKEVQAMNLANKCVLVRVETDNGLVGFGECSPQHASVICAVVNVIREVVLGESPFNIELLVRKMLYSRVNGYCFYKIGPGGALTAAISGIEIALWDILGKYYGQPIYNLLGGKCFPSGRLPVYASFHVQLRADNAANQDLIVQKALQCVEDGYRAIKLRIGAEWGSKFPEKPVDASVGIVERVRREVGEEISIYVDANCSYNVHTAIQIGRELEKLHVTHFEEPVAAYDLEGTKAVADALDLPIACGENAYMQHDFAQLIFGHVMDVLQVDVVKACGIFASKKVCAMADAMDIPVITHNFQGPMGTAASMHLAISTPNCNLPQEYRFDKHPMEAILREPFEIRDGYFYLSDRPGLGYDIDMDVVERNTIKGA
jgi:L-alanine-DL-glutamate epimerase-like enolase superfamily enzyme